MPTTRWVMTQRWNDLLFAHWPVPAAAIAPLLPHGLVPDTFDDEAYVGVVPFWMDAIRLRGLPAIPGASRFPELNLRTYVRERNTNLNGVYFFSLDAANPAAVAVARMFFHLPYYWSRMRIMHRGKGEFSYQSDRIMAHPRVRFRANYRSLGRPLAIEQSLPNSIEYFLTERYCLYTANTQGQLMKGEIHHLPWPLETAEAEFEVNELPAAHGITLSGAPPLLHYARELTVYVWPLQPVKELAVLRARTPVPVAKPL
jgi:uncharacterized protein YqjF (DUF2071 family)